MNPWGAEASVRALLALRLDAASIRLCTNLRVRINEQGVFSYNNSRNFEKRSQSLTHPVL